MRCYYGIVPSHFVVVFVNLIMLIAYRDNGNIYSTGTTSSSFSSKNYECVGNETSIHDCPNNEKKCTSSTRFLLRTELSCKSKTY